MQEEIEPQLSQLKIDQKDILRTELLVEEIFWRMTNQGKAEQVRIQVVKNFFSKVQVKMTSEGVPYNPLVELSDWSEDDLDEEYFRMMILKANAQKLHWIRKQNLNVVTINVRSESNKQLWLTGAGIVGGLICGVLMKEFFSPDLIAVINETIIKPFTAMFLHSLKMVIAPVVFFSIMSGIKEIGAGASVGKIGSKLIGIYLCTTVIASILGLIVAYFLFQGDVPQIGTIDSAAVDVKSYEFSLTQFIVGIIPSDLASPVANGNLLQIIFLAALFGMCLNALGDKVRLLQELTSNCNEFFMKVIGVIVYFVPIVTFFAMITLAVNIGVEVILATGKLIIGQLISSALMFGVYMLIIQLVGKISPLPFLKNFIHLWSVPFATSSSGVAMPFTMNFCTKRMGISPKISSFSIPIGTTVNMDGGCIYMPTAVIMFLKMYGVEVDLNAILIIFAMVISLSVGAPAVPNACVVCIITITATFGVPTDIAGILFCLGVICERIVTCFNVTGDVAASITLARTENLLDEKIYLS